MVGAVHGAAERDRRGREVLRPLIPPQTLPKEMGVSITEGLGQVLGSQHPKMMALTGRKRVAAKSGELCPLLVPSCRQPGRTQQLSLASGAPPAPSQTPQLPQHSPPSAGSGAELGTRLAPGARPGGEKGGGDGDGSSWEDTAKRDGSGGKGEWWEGRRHLVMHHEGVARARVTQGPSCHQPARLPRGPR